jgi:hypothetical protein
MGACNERRRFTANTSTNVERGHCIKYINGLHGVTKNYTINEGEERRKSKTPYNFGDINCVCN